MFFQILIFYIYFKLFLGIFDVSLRVYWYSTTPWPTLINFDLQRKMFWRLWLIITNKTCMICIRLCNLMFLWEKVVFMYKFVYKTISLSVTSESFSTNFPNLHPTQTKLDRYSPNRLSLINFCNAMHLKLVWRIYPQNWNIMYLLWWRWKKSFQSYSVVCKPLTW